MRRGHNDSPAIAVYRNSDGDLFQTIRYFDDAWEARRFVVDIIGLGCSPLGWHPEVLLPRDGEWDDAIEDIRREGRL